jgi:Tol biopolymer transport system component
LVTDIEDLDWARNQDILAFSATTGTSKDGPLYMLDIQTGSLSFVIDDASSPSWSPDDAQLVFDTGSVAPFKVKKIDQSGAVKTLVSKDGFDPDWRRCNPCP